MHRNFIPTAVVAVLALAPVASANPGDRYAASTYDYRDVTVLERADGTRSSEPFPLDQLRARLYVHPLATGPQTERVCIELLPPTSKRQGFSVRITPVSVQPREVAALQAGRARAPSALDAADFPTLCTVQPRSDRYRVWSGPERKNPGLGWVLPEVIRKLQPIEDPNDPRDTIGRNLLTVMQSAGLDSVCASATVVLVPFEGRPDFYDPALHAYEFDKRASWMEDFWRPVRRDVVQSAASDNPRYPGGMFEGPTRFVRASIARGSPSSIGAFIEQSRTDGFFYPVVTGFAREETIQRYLKTHPLPDRPDIFGVTGCRGSPLVPAGQVAAFEDVNLYSQSVLMLPYMANWSAMPPQMQAYWKDHLNDVMMHELVHAADYFRSVSEAMTHLRDQVELAEGLLEARARHQDFNKHGLDGGYVRSRFRADIKANPLLTDSLGFVTQAFNQRVSAYHHALARYDANGREGLVARYDNSPGRPSPGDPQVIQRFIEAEFNAYSKRRRDEYDAYIKSQGG